MMILYLSNLLKFLLLVSFVSLWLKITVINFLGQQKQQEMLQLAGFWNK